MHLYVYYLKQTYSPDFIQTLLGRLLGFAPNDISALSLPGEHKLRYEHRFLDASEFNAELSIFCWESDFESRTGGKKQLGARLSQALDAEVLVQHNQDNPHEWVLIHHDRFLLVPEKAGENIGINLLRDQARPLPV